MERSSLKSKLRTGSILAVLLLVAYFALTDEAGSFDVPGSADLGFQRVQNGFSGVVTWLAGSAKEKNREMQQVHDGYKTRTDERVEHSGGEAP